MKRALKRGGLAVLTSAPVYRGLRARALRGDPVTILCYHTLRSDDDRMESWLALSMSAFRAQIAHLRRDYEIVGLDDALQPSRPGGRPRAVLTFDDGEGAMHDLLLPLVEAEALPVTVYVATGHIETGRSFWFDRVMNALQADAAMRIDMRDEGLGDWTVGPGRGPARWAQISAILEALKAAPHEDRDRLADLVVARGGGAHPEATHFRPMSVDELRALAACDHVTIGAHSHRHELMDQIPLDTALASAVRSRDLLRDWTGREVRHFAYPNGNVTPALMVGLAQAGFATAAILTDRLVRADTPAMALPRVSVGRYDGLDRLRLRLVGL